MVPTTRKLKSCGASPCPLSHLPASQVLADLQRGGRHELALEVGHALDLGPHIDEPIGTVGRRRDHRDIARAAAKRQQERIELAGPELDLAGDQHLR